MSRLCIAGHHRRARALALVIVLACGSVTYGQQVTEQALKAAIIYNVARFAQWPDDVAASSPTFNACVLGDPAVGDELERAVKGRQLVGHPVSVLRVTPSANLRACHLLYVTGLPTRDSRQLVRALRGAPILTIGDGEDFARVGGIVQLFYEAGKIRFGINRDALKRSGIQIRSNVLQMATLIQEEPNGTAP